MPPNNDGTCVLTHLSEVKLIIKTQQGEYVERISPWATYVVEPSKEDDNKVYKQLVWHPPAHEVNN